MRIVLMMMLAVTVLVTVADTATAERVCETVTCGVECYPVPGGRRCHNRCLQRCWNQAPRYQPRYVTPEPGYVAPGPSYTPAATHYGADAFAAMSFLVVVAIVLFATIAGIAAAFEEPSIEDEIARFEQDALTKHALAHEAERNASDIDAYVKDEEEDAHRRGRTAADKQWKKQLKKGWLDG